MTAKLFTSLSVGIGVGLWCNLIALIVPYWWSIETETRTKVYVGLYKYCIPLGHENQCTSIISSDRTKWLVSVFVLMSLALLSNILSLGIISYSIFWYHDDKRKIKVALGAIMLGAIFTLSGIIVFSSKISSTFPGGRLSDSLVSAILSFVIDLLSFGFCLLGLIKDDFY